MVYYPSQDASSPGQKSLFKKCNNSSELDINHIFVDIEMNFNVLFQKMSDNAVASFAGTMLLIILASLSSSAARPPLDGDRMSDREGACAVWEEALTLLADSQ